MIIRKNDFSLRYRVMRVRHHSPSTGRVTADRPREFKTLHGAERYAEVLTSQGHTAVTQSGVVRWMSHEEAHAESLRLQSEGGQLQ